MTHNGSLCITHTAARLHQSDCEIFVDGAVCVVSGDWDGEGEMRGKEKGNEWKIVRGVCV